MKIFAACPAGGGTDFIIFNAENTAHAVDILQRDHGLAMRGIAEVTELTPDWLDDYYGGQATLSTERS